MKVITEITDEIKFSLNLIENNLFKKINNIS